MSQNRTELLDLLERHGLAPKKRLGQHFLADRNMVSKIVSLAGPPGGMAALEVGAGTGTLTRALADAGFAVTSYEVDGSLTPLLSEVMDGTTADLRFADALTLDAQEFSEGRWVFVANLPYNVGTPILLDLLRHAGGVVRCVVMVQREVAARLVAKPGNKDYGLPSVVVGLFGEARREFNVPPQVFVPPPSVDSAVVRIERTNGPDALRERAVEIAAGGFAQRRKMLRSSLRAVVPDAESTLEAIGIDPTRRAEELHPEQYLEIAAFVSA